MLLGKLGINKNDLLNQIENSKNDELNRFKNPGKNFKLHLKLNFNNF